LIGYGASSLLTERLMLSSDRYAVQVCQVGLHCLNAGITLRRYV